MKERPILMSAPMVRAILAGRKSQIRRPYKVKNGQSHPKLNDLPAMQQAARLCPLGTVGDRLWVRETWAWYGCEYLRDEVVYRADGMDLPTEFGRWRPSIHMPRWASRVMLEITDVRVERLCKISEADAIAEGFAGHDPIAGFADTWNEIYSGLSWANNPWVWVIDFRRVDEQSTKSK